MAQLAVSFVKVNGYRSSSLLRIGPTFLFLSQNKSNQAFDYQYLEKSLIPTLKFQKSLIRLPIPKLENTIDRYLSALKPIVADEDDYQNTVRIATLFKHKEGPELHEQLLKQNKANKHTSYISKPWFDMYLSSRAPLVINFAPFMAWKDDPQPEYMPVPIRATNMLISALRFKRSLRDNVLSPEVYHLNSAKSDTDMYRQIIRWTPQAISTYVSMAMKAFPLDMSQFASLFSTVRIPQKGKDVLKTYPDSKHIVVLKAGQFFSIEVLNEKGEIKPAEEIYSCIKHLTDLKIDENQDSITALSAENRDVWAEARDRLLLNQTNAKSLEQIDTAIFFICLDHMSFNPDTEIVEAARNYLLGNSSKQGTMKMNRWFDKSFGMIFDSAGHSSITFEHSWGDGVAVLRFFNDVYRDSTKHRFVHPDTQFDKSLGSQVKHLPFKLSQESQEDVSKADENWRKSTESLDMKHLLNDQMSRDYFKRKKVSPDSMFQLAFQMAFYNVHGTFAPTYESCSTAAFKHGRTEVVRAATNETKAAALAFRQRSISKSSGPSDREMRKMLDECSKKHFTLTKEAAMGQGFDRHLFALRLIAEQQGRSVDLFKDPNYSYANHFVLSTSSLFGEYFSGGGFGPVVRDGFGLGYGYIDNKMGFLCTCYTSERDAAKMTEAVSRALNQIREILETTAPTPTEPPPSEY